MTYFFAFTLSTGYFATERSLFTVGVTLLVVNLVIIVTALVMGIAKNRERMLNEATIAKLRGQLATGDALAEVGTNVWDATAPGDYGVEWKTLPLCDRTVWDATNSALFPRTCELLQACKVPLIEAFFAKMEPHSDIKPHSDGCNFVLTSHLGVDVPEGQCDLTVGDTTVEWRNGEVTLFDTSILHKAENRADVTRYILMLRVYHPELTAAERAALQLTFDCLDEPELLDDADALGEYELRRRHLEAESRKPWEAALAQKGFAKKGGKKKKR